MSGTRTYVKKKAKRLLIPMICVLLIWVMPIKIATGYYSMHGYYTIGQDFLFALKQLDLGHLWYLLVLFFINLIVYLFYSAIEKILFDPGRKIILLSVLGLISVFYYISDLYLPYLFGKFFKLLFFYMEGYCIQKDEKIYKKQNIIICISIQLFLVVFKAYLSNVIIVSEILTEFLVFLTNFIIGVMSVYALFGICEKLQHLANITIIQYMSKRSMDIYLFHEPVIYIMITIFNYYNLSSPWLFVVSSFTVSVGVSLLIADLIRCLKIGFFIGDKQNG